MLSFLHWEANMQTEYNTHFVSCVCGWRYEGYGTCDYSHLEELRNNHADKCCEAASLDGDPSLIKIANELHGSGRMGAQVWVMDRNVCITAECSICGATK